MTSEIIAQILLEKQAVLLNLTTPFQWASGILSPIYCDNRQILSYPNERNIVADALADLIRIKYPIANVVAGTATAGIPHAAWVSERLNLPMIYVRSSAKKHGRKQAIEGHLNPDDQVVLVEDLISTGKSVLDAAKIVSQTNKVVGVVSIFSYEFKQAREQFDQAHMTYHSLSNINSLIHIAKKNGFLNENEVELFLEWYKNYQ
ncbi:orotate phosphoribosyltransferase [Atopobacter phocae]|uniref:orotate phosphoribosyltransferase n=1 Tax=Atopobacter phocae TaxID=136492 RepID=UPI0004720335|nr:orotate phosphoribosyltransferase [Atopobacter phocae]